MSKPEDTTLKIALPADKTIEEMKAVISLAPESLSAAVLVQWRPFSDPPLTEVTSELRRQTKALKNGDMRRVDEMLFAQAHTLDGLFASLATRAAGAKSVVVMETYLKLALKAQNQSRATLQTLGELKAPKHVAFVRQANIGNQVQVNNGADASGNSPARSRTRKNQKNTPNKLLEADHGQRLDTRATGTTSGNDSELETVGEEYRPAKRGGKKRDGS